MAASIIDTLREKQRQARTGDSKWFLSGKHVFVIKGPPGKGPLSNLTGEAVFPLVLNPDEFSYQLPFAAEVTALQEGGVKSEEGGITIGELHLAGTTGFELKVNLGERSIGRGDGDFTGGLDDGRFVSSISSALTDGLSGQLHLWRLATRCFDAYSALKKDPEVGPLVSMEYHNLKDDLHLQIVPKAFVVERDSRRSRVSYRYDIRADVVGPALSDVTIPSPDTTLLQDLKDGLSGVRTAVQGLQAAIDDLGAAADELQRSLSGIGGLLSDVSGLVAAGTDLINGVKRFFDIPGAFIDSIGDLAESLGVQAATIASFPADVAQSLLDIKDHACRMKVSVRNHYQEAFHEVASKYDSVAEGYRRGKDPIRDEEIGKKVSSSGAAPGRLSVDSVFTGAKPGDWRQTRKRRLIRRLGGAGYDGLEEHEVSDGDSIQSLAAKHLGDARLWPVLVIANKLKAPYLSGEANLPGTLRVGDRILIPVANAPTSKALSLQTQPKTSEESLRALGTDFELVKVDNGYSWAVDTTLGATDARLVSGIKNLEQAIAARLRTERGHNLLYPAIGLPRQIGVSIFDSSEGSLRFSARQQCLADPRIQSVSSFTLQIEDDRVEFSASVVPIGSAGLRTISRIVE